MTQTKIIKQQVKQMQFGDLLNVYNYKVYFRFDGLYVVIHEALPINGKLVMKTTECRDINSVIDIIFGENNVRLYC